MTEQKLSNVDRFFEHHPNPVEILDRATDAVTLVELMYDCFSAGGNPLPITDDELSTIRQANKILIDQYYTMKGDTE